jgi:hypothetical protein
LIVAHPPVREGLRMRRELSRSPLSVAAVVFTSQV